MNQNENSFTADAGIFNSKYLAWFIAVLFLAAGLALTFIASGTCDDGDSVMHYQFARWAPVHHELFFNHWAKPLYVLIASPWAQFGVHGIKIFNLLVSFATLLITFSIAGLLRINRKALVVLIIVMSPGLIVHSLSGLTEPLFALILSASILLYLRNKFWFSVALVSFLPFVRSEGLIICGVFALMLLFEKRWKLLPLLLLGHVVYSLAGYWVYHNLLWVFTQIPYARLSSGYGKGNWSHFFVHLPEVIGIPLYVLLAAGLIAALPAVFSISQWVNNSRKWILLYGSFLSCFIGHVLFWKFGIFNSCGLLRVLIGILPMMALIELEGLNFLTGFFPGDLSKKIAVGTALSIIIIFPFLHFESSWNYRRDFCLTAAQLADKGATDYIKANYATNSRTQYYYDANYISVLLNIDYFDTTVSRRVWEQYQHPPGAPAFVMWDYYYSAFEFKTPFEVTATNPRFEKVKQFTEYDPWNYGKTTVLFKVKSPRQ